MATDLIRYDLLVQEALRGVVHDVLAETARNGLQGEHHFFVTFRTKAPGLRLSSRMRERYPDEMTIILQHQFWELAVTDHAFEVGLSFNKNPERLLVPFAAITSFVDPSVQFGLKFDVATDEQPDEKTGDVTPGAEKPAAAVRPTLAAVENAPHKPASKSQDAVVTPLKPHDIKPAVPALKPAPVPVKPPAAAKPSPVKAKDTTKDSPEKSGDEAKIVSIDSFRKKP